MPRPPSGRKGPDCGLGPLGEYDMKDEKESATSGDYYAQLMKNWQNFQQIMQEQIATAMKEQQNFQDNFTTKWMEETNTITKMMTGTSGGANKEFQDVYNVWKNYQNKINARIMKVSSIENNGYLDLMQRRVREQGSSAATFP